MTQKVYLPKKKRLHFFDIFNIILMGLFGLIIIYPFYNAIAISFLTQKGYATFNGLFSRYMTFQAYEIIFSEKWVLTGYKNSLIITIVGSVYSLFITATCAYAFTRKKFMGRNFIMNFFLLTMFFSGGVIPNFLLIRDLGLMDSLWSQILPTGMSVFYVLLMRNFFAGIPDGLKEAAMLDGAGEWRVLFSIILPLSMPVMATVALFNMVDRWNIWYTAMLYIRSVSKKPLQLCLREIINSSSGKTSSALSNAKMGKENLLLNSQSYTMASVMVTMVPIMLVYPFLQKYFVKGVVLGGIKE